MKKPKRTLLVTTLAAVFLFSSGMVLRQQLQYRQIASSNKEAAEVAGLPAQNISVIPSPPIEYTPTMDGNSQSELWPEDVAVLAELDLDALRAVNEDVVGWIDIPGTELSYPLMQGSDNQYYLSHDWKNEASSGGSVFLACSSSRSLSDFHTIVYAHRMRNDSMFGSLKYYKEPDYWREHPSVYLVIDDGVYRYDIFSAFEASVKCLVYQIELTGREEEFFQFCLNSSEIDTGIIPNAEDQILTLSTCTGNGHAERWIVQARLTQVYSTGIEYDCGS